MTENAIPAPRYSVFDTRINSGLQPKGTKKPCPTCKGTKRVEGERGDGMGIWVECHSCKGEGEIPVVNAVCSFCGAVLEVKPDANEHNWRAGHSNHYGWRDYWGGPECVQVLQMNLKRALALLPEEQRQTYDSQVVAVRYEDYGYSYRDMRPTVRLEDAPAPNPPTPHPN